MGGGNLNKLIFHSSNKGGGGGGGGFAQGDVEALS